MSELYLVTGASGHLGSAVTQTLLERHKTVRALFLEGEKRMPEGGVEICYGDVCDKESLLGLFENNDNRELIVIHCAGIVSITAKHNQKVYDVNVNGTKNIVDLCERYNVKKLVHVSSVHAIPERPIGETIIEAQRFDPDMVVGHYARSKAEATACVLDAVLRGLRACVVFPSGIIGPFDYGEGHMTTLVIDYCKRRLVAGIDGGYDFVDVRDVAEGILSACEKGRIGECYILSNRFYTVRDLLSMLHEITGKREIRTFLPFWFVKRTAFLSEIYYKLLGQPPLYTAYSVMVLTSNAIFSHEKATKELSYTTRGMRETLSDTVDWLRSIGTI